MPRFRLFMIACLVSLCALAAPAVAFTDVPSDHPYTAAIIDLSDRGIVNGYGDGRFGPDALVFRAQFAKMIDGALNLTVTEDLTSPFVDLGRDVQSDLYPHEYAAVAFSAGITKGITPTTFGPYVDITRAQVITMVVRAAQTFRPQALLLPSPEWRGAFPDGDPTHGANTRLAEYNGLLNRFGPSQDWDVSAKATRGEVAQLLYALDGLGTADRGLLAHPFVLWEDGALVLLDADGAKTHLLDLPDRSPLAWSADGREVYYLDHQVSGEDIDDWDLMAVDVALEETRLIVTSKQVTDFADRFSAEFTGVVNPATGEIYVGVDNLTAGSMGLVSVAAVGGEMQWRSGNSVRLSVSPGGGWLACAEYPLHSLEGGGGRFETLTVASATAGNGAEQFLDPPLTENRDTDYSLLGWWDEQTLLAYRRTALRAFAAPSWTPGPGPRGYPSGAAWFARTLDGTAMAYLQVEKQDDLTFPAQEVSLWMAAGDGSGVRRVALLGEDAAWAWCR